MSPHLIIILMISSCTLLVLLLFAVRKKAKKSEANAAAVQPPADALANISLDLSGLDMLQQKEPTSIAVIGPTEEPSIADLIQLVTRHRFFQGRNLETFSGFAQQKNWKGIQQLITEKMLAQGKSDAQQLAEEITGKLQKALIAVEN